MRWGINKKHQILCLNSVSIAPLLKNFSLFHVGLQCRLAIVLTTKIHSSSTIFRCRSLAKTFTSFINAALPRVEIANNFFFAICFPSFVFPWYTTPWKLSVDSMSASKVKRISSWFFVGSKPYSCVSSPSARGTRLWYSPLWNHIFQFSPRGKQTDH